MTSRQVTLGEIPFVRLVMLSLRVLVLPLVMAAVLLLALAPQSTANGVTVVDEYVVVSGDSLWAIAETVTGPGQDVRQTIAEIEELNGLASGTLQPGQVLLVPSDG